MHTSHSPNPSYKEEPVIMKIIAVIACAALMALLVHLAVKVVDKNLTTQTVSSMQKK